jgi:hypothetical protein
MVRTGSEVGRLDHASSPVPFLSTNNLPPVVLPAPILLKEPGISALIFPKESGRYFSSCNQMAAGIIIRIRGQGKRAQRHLPPSCGLWFCDLFLAPACY